MPHDSRNGIRRRPRSRELEVAEVARVGPEEQRRRQRNRARFLR